MTYVIGVIPPIGCMGPMKKKLTQQLGVVALRSNQEAILLYLLFFDDCSFLQCQL